MLRPKPVNGASLLSALKLGLAALFLLLATSAQAQTTVYWDTNGNANGSSNTTSNTWSQSSGGFWSTNSSGTSATTTWSSVASGNKIATFSAGTNATGTNTIAVGDTISDVAGLNFQEGTVTLNGAGTLTLNTSAPTFTVAGTASATIATTIGQSGYSGFTKDGTGNLTISGNNSFGDKVTVSAGTLTVASNNALGATTWGNVVSSGATLAFTNGVTVTEGQFTISGSGASSTGAIRNVSGSNTLNASLGLGGSATITSAAGTLNATGQIDLGSGNILTVNGSGNTTLSGDINNTGGITKSGAGTLTLSGSGANSFSGTLTVADGTVALNKTAGTNAIGGGAVGIGDGTGAAGSAVLRLDASNQIADYSGLITINADGKLQMNNFTDSINTLAGTGLVDLSTSGYLTVGVNSGSSSFGGSITGTGTLEKVGAGTLTFTSDINYSGTLTLGGGTLSLSNSDVTAGTLLVTANSIIDFGGTASTLSLTNLSISAGVTLTIQNWANATDFFVTQNWNGASFNTSGSSPMNQVVFTSFTANDTKWQAYDHQITPVPEPSTYGSVLVLSLILGAGFRRKFRGKR